MNFHGDLTPDLINLIMLCDKNPELANDIVNNTTRYPILYKKALDGIPTSIIITKPLSCKELNRMVKVTGSIIKTYPIFFKNVTSEQICLKCRATSYLSEHEASKLRGNLFCQSCGSSNLKTSQNFQHSFPIQTIKIQDMSNSDAMSETIEVNIEGEKVGVFQHGDKISVTGTVLRKWKSLRPNESMLSTLFIKAIQIIKDNDEENEYSEVKCLIDDYCSKNRFEKRSFIINSFCPELCGLYNVKLGFLLALIGGAVGNKDPGASRLNSHVLIVGDPGTGKSHLLKATSKLVSPSIFTNGVGTSDAGLTSCAVRYEKEWTLEAGALVLADTGICCIDEFNRLKISEKSGLLEAMEQQTLSVAKAGMVTTLNSRCSVFAAAGIRYNYDSKRSICDNLEMASPLVSRFDLIFGIFDKSNKDKDAEVCNYVLSRESPVKLPEQIRWSQTTLRTFISQCRKKKNNITEPTCDILLKYYTKKRTLEGVNEFNTIRMLESLVRLTEAHSKLMGMDDVTEEDSFIALILMETSINSASSIAIDVEKVFVDQSYFEKIRGLICTKYGIDFKEQTI
ncbi:uncharacterized protein VICG_00435 [Vittaforma corneae ATCC 50505]|uniref:DNA helicase n=1 Tax=Vittaforma corneae (strain ATCC 50505) TaxID=993615 RepID=L2GP71_VITCO|nr:uncharacterized protein VICG_00435 [Vittaforma corneae ATCC 50505]ELA42683.1 hypothetical protein VICG_00435 [Vittaforma corneae ATCC 50505]